VLVVEDDPKLGPLLARHLRRLGYLVSEATTGDQALAAVRARPPSALVIDVMIPHPDGLEVCRHLRSSGWTIPIVAISARCGADHHRRALDAGASAYLTKPFPLSTLDDALDAASGPEPPDPM
jgi:two-component system, OmpR family, response regulator MprA